MTGGRRNRVPSRLQLGAIESGASPRRALLGAIFMPENLLEPEKALPPTGAAILAGRVRWLGVASILLVAAFAKPLYLLVRHALASELCNYILLVPVISGYFIWDKRRRLALGSEPRRGLAMFPLVLGLTFAAAYLLIPASGPAEDVLFFATLSFVCLLIGGCMFFLGREVVVQLAFPLGFLFAAVPIPSAIRNVIEVFLQHGSAALAGLLFSVSNTTVLRDELTFRFPGFTLFVAPECSGIRSTLVLFVTSVVAAHVFLEKPASRALLCLAVLPVGILRNAIRIFTLGQLSIHISPDILNSYIHHKGGPLFFAAALVPFFLLLWGLRRFERRRDGAALTSDAPLT